MATFLQDLKFGAHLIVKAPGFTTVAALSLALGIGANTTIFTRGGIRSFRSRRRRSIPGSASTSSWPAAC